MSNKLAPMNYIKNYDNLSSETRAVVEGEVQRVLLRSADEVREMLGARRKELDLLAHALVEFETLDKREVEMVIRGESLGDRVRGDPGRMAVPVERPGGGGGAGVVPVPEQQPPPPTAA